MLWNFFSSILNSFHCLCEHSHFCIFHFDVREIVQSMVVVNVILMLFFLCLSCDCLMLIINKKSVYSINKTSNSVYEPRPKCFVWTVAVSGQNPEPCCRLHPEAERSAVQARFWSADPSESVKYSGASKKESCSRTAFKIHNVMNGCSGLS